MYRDGSGDEAGRDGEGVAFAVGGVHESDGRNLVAHLLGRLAGVSVAALKLDRLDSDRAQEVVRVRSRYSVVLRPASIAS